MRTKKIEGVYSFLSLFNFRLAEDVRYEDFNELLCGDKYYYIEEEEFKKVTIKALYKTDKKLGFFGQSDKGEILLYLLETEE